MQSALYLSSQRSSSLFVISDPNMSSLSQINALYSQKPTSFLQHHFHLNFDSVKTHPGDPIVCARRSKRRPFLGSAKSRKLLFESAYFIASKLKILPEPLDLMIREYAGGSGGGGSGFWNGYGWGGGFDGWGRRKKRIKWKFWGSFVILGISVVVWLILAKDLEFQVILGNLGLALFGFSMNGWWTNGFRDWALGFCCCAVLLGWALNRNDLQKFIKGFFAMDIVRRRRKKSGIFLAKIQKFYRN